MAKKVRRPPANADEETQGITPADKIAGALALIAVKGMEAEDSALKLDAIGFTAREIAGLLDVGINYVNVARFKKKAAGKRTLKKKAG